MDGSVVGGRLFAVALLVLRRELHEVSYRELVDCPASKREAGSRWPS
jgi:hypothetical protein